MVGLGLKNKCLCVRFFGGGFSLVSLDTEGVSSKSEDVVIVCIP